MTLKNNRAPLLCCFQLCAWFHCHMWIQTGVRVRKRLSWVLTSVTLTFDLWPWPFAWTSLLTMVITPENFMMIRWWEHGEKGVTDRRTDRRTDRQTDGQTDGLNQSYSCLVAAKNNRAPLLCYFKLYASFHSHRWIQAGVTVRKRPIWVKIIDFFSRVTLQFDVWPWKTIGHLFYATSSFVHHFVAIGDSKLEIQSRNAQFGSKSTIFRAVWPWNSTYELEKQ